MDRYRGFDINTLRQQMEDLFDDFFPSSSRRPSGGRQPEQESYQPLPLNILETDTELIVLAPLSGLTPEDIEISVRGQTLTIKAQRHDPYPERKDYVRREWGYGPFQRNVELSFPVDADNAQARFRHGVVTLTLPKADTQRPRKINLDTASDVEESGAGAPAEEDAETFVTEVDDSATESEMVAVDGEPSFLSAAAEEGDIASETVPGATPEMPGGPGGAAGAPEEEAVAPVPEVTGDEETTSEEAADTDKTTTTPED